MIVAGFGFTSRATADSLWDALAATEYAAHVDHVATVTDKTDAAAFIAIAARLNARIIPVHSDRLETIETETRSTISRTNRATGSVAEAAALAAAGPDATLITARHISHDRMATCAIAKGADT